MIAVISEVWPHPARLADYFELSAELRKRLAELDGFVSSERFESCTEPGKFVSVSIWRNEESLARWRNHEEHRVIMAKGRDGIFRDYHIRVASVTRDYSMNNRSGAPLDSQ